MLTDQEISLKHYHKERLVSLLREEELNGMRGLKSKRSWKVMLIHSFFTLWSMASTENNIFIDLKMTKALLLVLITSKDTLLIITKICLGPQNRRRSL
jgi:hypothetical protein